jgi:hypothetical protein
MPGSMTTSSRSGAETENNQAQMSQMSNCCCCRLLLPFAVAGTNAKLSD